MRVLQKKIFLLFILTLLLNCNNSKRKPAEKSNINEIKLKYAKGFKVFKTKDFTLLRICNPWPNSKLEFNYVLVKKGKVIPDSINSFSKIELPVKKIVVNSTTHIPALELLNVEDALIGFPDTQFISSPKIKNLVLSKKIKEVGQNEKLSTEALLELAPDVIVAFGIDNHNPVIESLQKSGLKVIFNGDWNEQSPLGKAEWIKFFGILFDKEKEASTIFDKIELDYIAMQKLAQKTKENPTVLSGSLLEKIWYVPQGKSWVATFLNDANCNYLWKNTNGSGSLALSFEKVLENAKDADFWIAPGNFNSIKEMEQQNIHYKQFKAFKNKNIYTYWKNNPNDKGILYFEQAGSRPDLVLKDLIYILHPELLPHHQLNYFKKLN